jgi:hypothetical protein
MNKQTKITLKNPFGLKIFKYLKNKKILAIIILLVLTLLAIGTFVITRSHNNNAHNKTSAIDINRINELKKSRNCQAAVSELRNVQPNEQDVDASISLLSLRAVCYYELEQYPQALVDYQTLKIYLDKKGDINGSSNAASLIMWLKDRIAHPKPKSVPVKQDLDQMTPDFQKKLKDLGEGESR